MTSAEFVSMDVASRLKYAREKKGCSVDDVAKAVGVTKSAIQMYECGQRVPRDSVKVELSKFYGVSVQRLFF